jgi:hypothetical protein
MTNKVKPFFIRITDDMTPQMVQDAFDKCVDAGATADECIADTNRKHSYQDSYHENFNYFGVSDYNETYLTDDHCNYGECAQEITLDQLDEWLGLDGEHGWDGEGLPPVGVECEILDINGNDVIGSGTIYHVDANKFFVLSESLKNYPEESTINMFDGTINLYVMWVNNGDKRFRKPETPEQKAERERLEAAYDLYLTRLSVGENYLPYTYDEFLNEKMTRLGFLAIVDKTNYRKQ